MGYIYKITNKLCNRSYIGQTRQLNINDRWKKHKQTNSEYGCPLLKKAIKDFGIANFIFEIIIICFDNDLNYYEKEYIKKYNTVYPNGYNVLIGGNAMPSRNGKNIYQFSLDKVFINEYASISQASRILNINETSIRNSIKNKKPTKSYIFTFNKNDIIDYTTYNKKVYQYSLDGIFINEYDNIQIAEKLTKTNNILLCVNNLYNYSNNFIWRNFKVNKLDNFQNKKTGGKKLTVYQYNTENQLINVYDSITDVHIKLKFPISSISLSIKQNKLYNGYYWKIIN